MKIRIISNDGEDKEAAAEGQIVRAEAKKKKS